MARLFVTAHIQDKILERVQAMHCNFPGAHPTNPEQLHLTLRFIGEVEEVQVLQVRERLKVDRQ